MLLREVLDIYSENYIKPENTSRVQNAKLCKFQRRGLKRNLTLKVPFFTPLQIPFSVRQQAVAIMCCECHVTSCDASCRTALHSWVLRSNPPTTLPCHAAKCKVLGFSGPSQKWDRITLLKGKHKRWSCLVGVRLHGKLSVCLSIGRSVDISPPDGRYDRM
jgi:hypothetical protein